MELDRLMKLQSRYRIFGQLTCFATIVFMIVLDVVFQAYTMYVKNIVQVDGGYMESYVFNMGIIYWLIGVFALLAFVVFMLFKFEGVSKQIANMHTG